MNEDKLLDLEALTREHQGELTDEELADVAGGRMDMGKSFAALCNACNQVVSNYYPNYDTPKNAVSLMNAIKVACPKCGVRGDYSVKAMR